MPDIKQSKYDLLFHKASSLEGKWMEALQNIIQKKKKTQKKPFLLSVFTLLFLLPPLASLDSLLPLPSPPLPYPTPTPPYPHPHPLSMHNWGSLRESI